MTNAIERVEYRFGNPHSPTQPQGRVELTLRVSGTAELVNLGFQGRRVWKALVDPGLWPVLATALDGARFPQAPRLPIPAGSAIRDLTVSGEVPGRVLLPWHAAVDQPGYHEVFSILDAIIEQASQGELPRGAAGKSGPPTPQPIWVTDIRPDPS